MDEKTFIKANTRYLDIAKEVTGDLCQICLDTKKDYTGLEIINGISTGIYVFFKGMSKSLNISPLELHEQYTRWFEHMDSVMNEHEVQTQEGVSGSEN